MRKEVNLLDKSRTKEYDCLGSFTITKEQWISLLNDVEIITEKDFQLFTVMYNNYDCDVPVKQLSQQLKLTRHYILNFQVKPLGERIAKELKIPDSSLQVEGKVRRWIVPFCGKDIKGTGYCWKLRPELQEAMGEILEKRFEKK